MSSDRKNCKLMQSLQESNRDRESANNSRATNIYLRVIKQKIERNLFIDK